MFVFSMCCTHRRMMTDLKSMPRKRIHISTPSVSYWQRISSASTKKPHLFCYKCDAIMIDHLICLTKNWIEWFPGPFICIIDGYKPRNCKQKTIICHIFHGRENMNWWANCLPAYTNRMWGSSHSSAISKRWEYSIIWGKHSETNHSLLSQFGNISNFSWSGRSKPLLSSEESSWAQKWELGVSPWMSHQTLYTSASSSSNYPDPKRESIQHSQILHRVNIFPHVVCR